MVISDENNHPTLIKPTNLQESETGARKFGMEIRPNGRRALGVNNQNFIGAQPCPHVINKRDLSDTHALCDKNLPNQTQKPITRELAAQIESKQQPFPQESKKSNPWSPHNFSVWEDCPVAGVDEQEGAVKNRPVRMSLEQTEATPNEKNHMEVEMEDTFEDPVENIDSCDARNPLAVVDYVEELYAYYRKMENCNRVSPNYMAQQFDINEKMRAILIDWLIEVHYKFDLRDETLFLTVNLIDRFLAQQVVVRKKLQLVGLVAMLLACKYEEVSVPVVEDIVFISDNAYSRTQVLEMEILIVNTLEFNMSVPTPYVFMKRYLKAAKSNRKLELLSFFLIELCLVEFEMLNFAPSFLAAAAIYTAQCSLYGFKQWSKTCEWHTSYSENQLLECSKLIVSFHQKAATGKLTGVHRKYSIAKFGSAAKCEAANFLVETNQ